MKQLLALLKSVDIIALLILHVFLYICLYLCGDLQKNIYAFLAIQTLIICSYTLLAIKLIGVAKLNPKWILGAFGIIYIILLIIPATLSSDVYRYFWDGMLTSKGINPYLFEPQNPAFVAFQNLPLYKILWWKELNTPYPPLAQLTFTGAYVAYLLAGNVGGKLVMSLPIFLLAFVAYKVMDKRFWAILILNPLLLFEAIHSAHINIGSATLVFLAFLAYEKKQYLWSALAIGMGIAVKTYPSIFAPIFVVWLVKDKKYTQAAMYCAVVFGVVGLTYLPYLFNTPYELLFNFATIQERFLFNQTLSRYILDFMAWVGIQAPANYYSLLGLSLIVFNTVLAWFVKGTKALILAGIGFMLLSPIMYPWYLTFMIPLIVYYAFKTEKLNSGKVFVVLLVTSFMMILLGLTYIYENRELSIEIRNLYLNRIANVEFITLVCGLIALGLKRFNLHRS